MGEDEPNLIEHCEKVRELIREDRELHDELP